MNARELWIWLALAFGPANTHAVQLVAYFGDIRSIYKADETKLRKFTFDYGIANAGRIITALSNKDLKPAQNIIKWAQSVNVGIITLGDAKYPKQLAKINNMPIVLYYFGTVPDTVGKLTVAVVGTRDMTEYGKMAAYDITFRLARAGSVIVSGLAKGIDGTAAAAAIDANGQTIAVLGSGIDVLYPREHDMLYGAVAKRGMIVTEYTPGTPPAGRNFPIRNRIISGLARATLVIEANTTSGALITARETLKQGRDLFAVPGRIKSDSSSGTNALIRDGAHAAISATDILDMYRDLFPDSMSIYSAWQGDDFTSEYIDERLKLWRVANVPAASASTEGHGIFGGRSAAKKPSVKITSASEVTPITAPSDEPEVDESGTSYVAPASVLNYLQKQFRRTSDTDAQADDAYVKNVPFTNTKNAVATNKHKSTEKTDVDLIKTPATDASADNPSELPSVVSIPETESIKETEAVPDDISETERQVFMLMKKGTKYSTDDLINSGADPAEVNAALTMLSIKGYINELPGNLFTK